MLTSSNTTDLPTICTSQLAANGSIQIDPYCEASTSAAGMNTMQLIKNDFPSTSTTINQLMNSEICNMDQIKRQKIDQKIDIDDTCSNDAFVFNSSLKGKPLKSNQKTTTVPNAGPK